MKLSVRLTSEQYRSGAVVVGQRVRDGGVSRRNQRHHIIGVLLARLVVAKRRGAIARGRYALRRRHYHVTLEGIDSERGKN